MAFAPAKDDLPPELLLERSRGLKGRERRTEHEGTDGGPTIGPGTIVAIEASTAGVRALPRVCLGCFFLIVGIAGVFLPLVPGTVFLILSAACFARSSPRFEAWLLGHPRFGPPVRKWRETGAIPRPVKIFAILSLALSWLILLATEAPEGARIASLVLFATVAVFIATRPHA
jgi:uncharacterized protein